MKLLCDRDKCYFCTTKEPTVFPKNKQFRRLVEIHHIIEKNEGGSNSPENKIPACSSCHSKIHLGIIVIGKWLNFGSCYKLQWWTEGVEHFGSYQSRSLS